MTRLFSLVRVPTSYIGRRPQTLVWLVWEAPSDETSRWCEFQRVISAGGLRHSSGSCGRSPSDETFLVGASSNEFIGRRPQTLVWLVWEAPSDETFSLVRVPTSLSAGGLRHSSGSCGRFPVTRLFSLVRVPTSLSAGGLRHSSGSCGRLPVTRLFSLVRVPTSHIGRRPQTQSVWLVWEVAHPSDETFRRAWGACANVCAQGVERACELSRRATMEWSELSRSACANVCAQGGVAWSELRRCRADEAYRPAASDTRLACVGGSQ